jgi:hypothetical protein
VWFDAIRLTPLNLSVSVTNQQPANASWHRQRAITFNWLVQNVPCPASLRLQASTDAGFGSLVLDQWLATSATSYTHTFAQDYPRLYWRVVVTTSSGQTVTSAATWIGIDTVAPTSAVDGVYRLENGKYVIAWSGSDATSGVASYIVDYQPQGGSWIRWLTGSTAAALRFPFAINPPTVYFRSQATDVAGNTEPANSGADFNSSQYIQLYQQAVMPVIK